MSFLKWTVTLVLCLCIAGSLAAYKVLNIRASIAAGEAYPEQSGTVEASRVTSADYRPTLTVIGEIVAPQRLDLRNEFAGEITSVNFASGDEVKQGQLLIKLDTSLEEANLEAAHARVNLANLSYERSLKLLDSGLSNQEQLDQARSDLATANAEIAVLERTITKKTLSAPFNGRTGLHNFEVGQYLQQNTLISSLIGDTDLLWVDFQVPQFYPPLSLGSVLPLSAIGNTATGESINATIMAENTVLNASSRSRSYRASLPNTVGLSPQAMVSLQAPISEAELLLAIPPIAVQNDPLGQYVYLLKEDAETNAYRAVRQQVKVVVVNSNAALLNADNNLKVGDLIATDGAFKLYGGILVHIGERSASAGEEASH